MAGWLGKKGGVTDHGDLTGLEDDDHTQYILKSLLTTHGDVLFRNASGVQRLGAGTSGQFLKTLGVGANPAWATPAGSGSDFFTEVTPNSGSDLVSKIEGYKTNGSKVVLVPPGTYSPTETIDISGDTPDPGIGDFEQFIIKGAGMGRTIINAPNDLALFELDNAPSAILADLEIVRPAGTAAKEAILCNNTGSEKDGIVFGGGFKRVLIKGGSSTTTSPAVHVKEPWQWHGFEDCYIDSYGDSLVKIEIPSGTSKLADCDLFHGTNFFRQNKGGSSMSACTNVLELKGNTDGGRVANLRHSGHMQLWAHGSAAFVCAIKMQNVHSVHIGDFHTENCYRVLETEDTVLYCSLGPSTYVAGRQGVSDQLFFEFSSGTKAFVIHDLSRIYNGSGTSATVVKDENTDSDRPNILRHIHVVNYGTLTPGSGAGWTNKVTVFKGLSGDLRSECSDHATIDNGTDHEVITFPHELIRTPEQILFWGTTNDTKAMWGTDGSTTGFTLRVPSAVGANRTVGYMVSVNKHYLLE